MLIETISFHFLKVSNDSKSNFTHQKIIHQTNCFNEIENFSFFFFSSDFFFSQILLCSPQTSMIDHNANLHSGNEVKSHHESSNTFYNRIQKHHSYFEMINKIVAIN